mmetsp:Transcript_37513/g.95262  ORF Transcript_37513/g.95262 Transcript_37513/m.95262 type:complete len:213 (+) Transcript_37513:1140-1778(+)
MRQLHAHGARPRTGERRGEARGGGGAARAAGVRTAPPLRLHRAARGGPRAGRGGRRGRNPSGRGEQQALPSAGGRERCRPRREAGGGRGGRAAAGRAARRGGRGGDALRALGLQGRLGAVGRDGRYDGGVEPYRGALGPCGGRRHRPDVRERAADADQALAAGDADAAPRAAAAARAAAAGAAGDTAGAAPAEPGGARRRRGRVGVDGRAAS